MSRIAIRLFFAGWIVAACCVASTESTVLIADFEGDDYGEWEVTGRAFGAGPARGTLPGQNPVSGFEGQGLVNSFYEGDDSEGRLRSPLFTINRPYLNVLIGGGAHAGKTCFNLLINEVVRLSFVGRESEQLEWRSIDLSHLQGATARIEIVDQQQGGWGHINVDHIELSDVSRAATVSLRDPDAPARRVTIDRPYLHLPVKTGTPKQRMRLVVGNTLLDEFDIELALVNPDFYTFVDLSAYRGQELAIEADIPGDELFVLDGLELHDTPPGAEGAYQERYRPQFHFSARRGWLNDPNGLVYFQGEYHLFFQHNPYGWNWGNMHWGHAVSRDLVHWEELPVALTPRAYGDWAFSGSAVIDWKNTSGFQSGPEPPLVIAFTSTGRGECIAYSRDRGRTFSEFSGNPVVKHDGRDPKLIWHGPSNQWVMAVYEILNEGTPEKQQTIGFYTSPDLKVWTHQSNLEGFYECPELFELPVDGNHEETRWVVYGADNAYMVGAFDGSTFTPEGPKQPGVHGGAFYAAQTYSDIAASDGRRIEIGWLRSGHAEMPFNQMMAFPTSLSLRRTPEGIRLYKEPVWEITALHEESRAWQEVSLTAGGNLLEDFSGELIHLEMDIAPQDADRITLDLRGVTVVYHPTTETLQMGEISVPLPLEEGAIHLEVLVDRLSVELYGNYGAVYVPLAIAPDLENRRLSLHVDSGTAMLKGMVAHRLKSAWK